MLRIFVLDEPLTLKLRLEGVLDDISLPEFDAAIAAARAQRGNRRFAADVGNLRVLGAAAQRAILEKKRSGLTFVAAIGSLAELLKQQEQRDCQAQCGLLRRIAFFASRSCESSTRPLCMRLHRLLHGYV